MQSGDFRALYDEIAKSELAQSREGKYILYRIAMDCLSFQAFPDNVVTTNKKIPENQRSLSLAAVSRLRQSCRGFEKTPESIKALSQLRVEAEDAGEPRSAALASVGYNATGQPSDAFLLTRGLLTKYPTDPMLLEPAITLLTQLGVRPGQGIDSLAQYSDKTVQLAASLAACESQDSCPGSNSNLLDSLCALAGTCASNFEDYLMTNLLTPAEANGLRDATNQLRQIIDARDWRRLGFSDANKPSQTKPSIIPADPNPIPKK